MALAILDLLDTGNGGVRFNIDTGTNRYYRLKAGRSVTNNSGIDWVDDVFMSTPIQINENGGNLLNSSRDISVPLQNLLRGRTERGIADRNKVYVQLFSFKTAEGKSPAFSRVVKVPTAPAILAGSRDDFALPFSTGVRMRVQESFATPRRIPCTSYGETYSTQAGWEDILGGIVKVAGPAVMDLLKGLQNSSASNTNTSGTTAGGTSSTPTTNGGQPDFLKILTSIIGTLTGGGTQTAGSQAHSLTLESNRFLNDQHHEFARPFIFGIDDVLIAQLAGPILNVLPQLMNSANQNRLQLKQANNTLVQNLVSDVNRRMMMDKLLEAQKAAPATGPGNAADIGQLLALLQQVPANQTAGAPAAPAPAPNSETKSIATALSRTAVVAFTAAAPVTWNGSPRVAYARDQAIQLKVKLVVAEPAPKTPLPKAIITFTFKDADQTVHFEKAFKQKNVAANADVTFTLPKEETQRIPANKPLTLFAEVRWLSTNTGKEYKAIGSQDVVFVGKFSLKDQGAGVSEEQELTDMKRFRSFWNKVWEAPSLAPGSPRRNGDKKYLWELVVDAKYSVLLSAAHDANGLMDTKLLKAKPDSESLSERTEGRMKGGIELSIAELNKLASLWNGASPLDPERLEALKTDAFVRRNAGEFVHHFKLKGKAADRGMVWVIPTFKLFEITLAAVSHVDETGQVTAMADEKVRFPLPVSARVIGLKSK